MQQSHYEAVYLNCNTMHTMIAHTMHISTPYHPIACHRLSIAVLKISGEKVRDYLQGQITQDITKLSPEHPIYTAILTPQGKIVADCHIVDGGDELILLTQASHAAPLIARLKRFALGYDIRLGVVTSLAVLSIQGEQALSLGQDKLPHIAAHMPMPEAHPNGVWFVIPQEDIAKALKDLPQTCDEQTMDKACILYGTPRFGRDWDESVHPLNANLIEMKGVSFDKGCYVGQEVTSRMHWRNGIKKKLYHVQIQDEPMDAPSPVFSNDINIGKLTAVATDENGKHFGIAHLPIETVEKNTPLSLENQSTLRVIEACHA